MNGILYKSFSPFFKKLNSINLKRKIIRINSLLLFLISIFLFFHSTLHYFQSTSLQKLPVSSPFIGYFLSLLLGIIAFGFWKSKNWAKFVVFIIALPTITYFTILAIFNFSTIVFGGKEITPINIIFYTFLDIFIIGLLKNTFIPISIIFMLKFLDEGFYESQAQRNFFDRIIRYVLLAAASSSLFIVAMIFLFTLMESTEAISTIGLNEMLIGTIWRPGSIIGTSDAQFGLVPMIIGSIYSTIGAIIIGVPLSIGTAILLAEIAPPFLRDVIRPAIELLAGIPSVIYGLFGMIVIAPLIRNFEIPGNSGFGLLNGSLILAIMILPTITNISEDAISAVPDSYRSASLALGATRWQTIKSVILPAARSGIMAGIILGIGRALGETMALIMVIGNSIAIPIPLTKNPLTLLLATARTLTGNIAVEINYAAGAHRSALFFTGVLLFMLLFFINQLTYVLLRENNTIKE
jgi:phosphate transport system permease protein